MGVASRTHVDLFSGIGGFALACNWAAVETVAFAEIDPYASRVIERHFPGVTNYGRVQDVPAIGDVWLVTGGVPCQPASIAGKRLGTADDRWLWPEALAAVERIRPAWVLFENPTGILSLNDRVEFERICASLEGQGYEVQPIVIPACGVGALHRRNRVWIVAHAVSEQLRASGHRETLGAPGAVTSTEKQRQRVWVDTWKRGKNVADPNGKGPQGRISGELRECADEQPVGPRGSFVADASRERLNRDRDTGTGRGAELADGSGWAVEPNVGRVANGIPKRVDRLRCLGNAIVPQVAYRIIKRMIEAEGGE